MGPAFRLLPVVVISLVLMLAVRATELWTGLSTIGAAQASDTASAPTHAEGEGVTASVPAAAANAPVPAAAPTAPVDPGAALPAPTQETHASANIHDETATDEAKDHNIPEIANPEAPPPPPPKKEEGPAPYTAAAARPKIPGESDFMSASEIEVLSSLTKRREELDKRAAELDMREKLLIATEQRLGQKLAEIKVIEAQIQSTVKTLDENQAKQIASLVKVYETMKPKDAASIMQDLDKEILIEVASRMKEAKMAPILAAMEPQKAREITMMLAKRNEIPGREG